MQRNARSAALRLQERDISWHLTKPLPKIPVSPAPQRPSLTASSSPSSIYTNDDRPDSAYYADFILSHYTDSPISPLVNADSDSSPTLEQGHDASRHSPKRTQGQVHAANVFDNLQRSKIISRFTSQGKFSELFSPALSPPSAYSTNTPTTRLSDVMNTIRKAVDTKLERVKLNKHQRSVAHNIKKHDIHLVSENRRMYTLL